MWPSLGPWPRHLESTVKISFVASRFINKLNPRGTCLKRSARAGNWPAEKGTPSRVFSRNQWKKRTFISRRESLCCLVTCHSTRSRWKFWRFEKDEPMQTACKERGGGWQVALTDVITWSVLLPNWLVLLSALYGQSSHQNRAHPGPFSSRPSLPFVACSAWSCTKSILILQQQWQRQWQ